MDRLPAADEPVTSPLARGPNEHHRDMAEPTASASTASASTASAHPVHTVHRVGIGALGLFLLSFGLLGLIRRLEFTATDGVVIMGLASNGLLAVLSVLVALILCVAAVRGGPAASAVGIGAGVLFLVSGIAHMFVLGTAMNMLAFQVSNVLFSVVVGMVMLFTGAYGRLTGGLPPDNPYYRGGQRERAYVPDQRTPAERVTDQLTDRELAEAGRAVALHYATAEQAEGVRRAAAFRTAEDRRAAYRRW